MDVDIKWGRKDGLVIAMLAGRFSSANAPLFESLLENGIDPSDHALILDFEHVTFLSSAGLRVVLSIGRQFNKPGKKYAMCALQEGVRGIVKLSGIDRLIPVYDTQTSAVAAYEAKPSP